MVRNMTGGKIPEKLSRHVVTLLQGVLNIQYSILKHYVEYKVSIWERYHVDEERAEFT